MPRERESWDTAEVVRIVRKHSGHVLTQRQLQIWDQNGIVVADQRGEKRKRLYSFQSIRRLCIIARLLKEGFPAQRLGEVLRNLDRAAKVIGKSWDMLRLGTNRGSVIIIDGDKGIDAIGGQIVSLVLLGEFDKRVREICRDEGRRKVA